MVGDLSNQLQRLLPENSFWPKSICSRRFGKQLENIQQVAEQVSERIKHEQLISEEEIVALKLAYKLLKAYPRPSRTPIMENIQELFISCFPCNKDLSSQFSSSNLSYRELEDLRRDVFIETKKACEQGYLLAEELIELDPSLLKKMQKQTEVYTLETSEKLKSHRGNVKTQFLVENIDTFDLMKRLQDEGYNPVGLNMANKDHPGGGVNFGAPAQEESLFRRSNYYRSLFTDQNPHLSKQFPRGYQIPERGLIYSPSIQVFRSNEKEGYSFCQPYTVAMIAAAAYDRRPLGDGLSEDEIVTGMKDKVRAILRCASHKKHDAVVLGAWGCGAFMNDPEVVSQLMLDVFNEEEFKNQFSLIAFPILKVPYSKNQNLEIFREKF